MKETLRTNYSSDSVNGGIFPHITRWVWLSRVCLSPIYEFMLHYPQLGGGGSDWPIERHVWVLHLLTGSSRYWVLDPGIWTGYWYQVSELGTGTRYLNRVLVPGSTVCSGPPGLLWALVSCPTRWSLHLPLALCIDHLVGCGDPI